MRTDWKVRGLGLLLVAAALPAPFLLGRPVSWMLSFALAVTGLFLAVVVADRAVPAQAATALLLGNARETASMRRGLKLNGRPIYVHDQGNVGEERLFLPASDNTRPVPILDRETATYSGTGGTRIGVALPPAGLALLDAHERSTRAGLNRAPLPEVEAFLKGLCLTHDLARSLRLTREKEGLRVRFATAAVNLPCLEEPASPPCERTGCALCHVVGCSLARSLGRPVTVTGADVEPPWVTLHLQAEEPQEEDPG